MTTSWGSWILSFVVLLLVFLSGYIMRNSVRLLITGKRAQGIVVENTPMYTLEKDGKITYHDPFQPAIDFINR